MASTIRTIRQLVNKALMDEPTGDEFLDRAYDDYARQVGHPNPYYRLIFLLARKLQPECYVEIGVDTGLALCHAAAGCPSCCCIGIDSWPDSEEPYQVASQRAAHYPNIRLVRGWSIPEAAELWIALHPGIPQKLIDHHRAISDMSASVPERIDMLFIDAWHEARFVLREWEIYASRVPHGGIVLCDDITGRFPEMSGFWEAVNKGRWITTEKLHPGTGFGVILK